MARKVTINICKKGVVRFELPYDGFCIACGANAGRGTRFNALKSKAGAYLTSPIYEFRMKCRICAAVEFVIRTNPKEQGFDYLSGIHKRVQESVDAAGVILETTDDGNRLVRSAEPNSLAHLETFADGKRKAATERDALDSLLKKARIEEGAKLGWAKGMEVLDHDRMEDVVAAKSITYSDGKMTERLKWRRARCGSIFSSAKRSVTVELQTQQVPSQERSGQGSRVKLTTAKQDFTPDKVASRVTGSNSSDPHHTSAKARKKLILNSNRGKVTVTEFRPPVLPTSLNLLATYGSDSD
ncbi:Family of unknown function (DUF572) [Fragilaria crotonensis]|nr:Family of unknown function (DUF572) [Fragilaria crotonensis]